MIANKCMEEKSKIQFVADKTMLSVELVSSFVKAVQVSPAKPLAHWNEKLRDKGLSAYNKIDLYQSLIDHQLICLQRDWVNKQRLNTIPNKDIVTSPYEYSVHNGCWARQVCEDSNDYHRTDAYLGRMTFANGFFVHNDDGTNQPSTYTPIIERITDLEKHIYYDEDEYIKVDNVEKDNEWITCEDKDLYNQVNSLVYWGIAEYVFRTPWTERGHIVRVVPRVTRLGSLCVYYHNTHLSKENNVNAKATEN